MPNPFENLKMLVASRVVLGGKRQIRIIVLDATLTQPWGFWIEMRREKKGMAQ